MPAGLHQFDANLFSQVSAAVCRWPPSVCERVLAEAEVSKAPLRATPGWLAGWLLAPAPCVCAQA